MSLTPYSHLPNKLGVTIKGGGDLLNPNLGVLIKIAGGRSSYIFIEIRNKYRKYNKRGRGVLINCAPVGEGGHIILEFLIGGGRRVTLVRQAR